MEILAPALEILIFIMHSILVYFLISKMIACTSPPVRYLFCHFLFFRIKRRILLLIPKWLYEDIPKLENSKVVKILQVTKHH